MINRQGSIGIFDSGLGGLSVFQEIKYFLPHEHLIYLADTLHFPYGNKTRECLFSLYRKNTSFLLEHNIKALVIACGTASSIFLKDTERFFPFPVIEIINPSIHKASLHSPLGKFGIFATQAAVNFNEFTKKIKEMTPNATISSLFSSSLVEAIENGHADPLTISSLLQNHLSFFKNQEMESLILGCTHFNLIEREIQSFVAPHINVINTAKTCAESLYQVLKDYQLLNPYSSSAPDLFFTTGDAVAFKTCAEKTLPLSIEFVSKISQPSYLQKANSIKN